MFMHSLSSCLSDSLSPAKWERASAARGVLCHQPPWLLRLVLQGKKCCLLPGPPVTALLGVSAASLDETAHYRARTSELSDSCIPKPDVLPSWLAFSQLLC